MASFDINYLDHVAIRVIDISVSANWYKKVLGLKRYQLPEWGEYPIFLMAGKTGIAIFPANPKDPQLNVTSKSIKIDHFAFNVTLDNFKKAKLHYHSLGIDYTFQDHYYFHSIYTKDPDGHVVELTTLVVDEHKFYK